MLLRTGSRHQEHILREHPEGRLCERPERRSPWPSVRAPNAAESASLRVPGLHVFAKKIFQVTVPELNLNDYIYDRTIYT